jgi:hypothetical protein
MNEDERARRVTDVRSMATLRGEEAVAALRTAEIKAILCRWRFYLIDVSVS